MIPFNLTLKKSQIRFAGLSLLFMVTCFLIGGGNIGRLSLLFLGLLLSYFDLKTKTYPLIIWLTASLLLLFFYPMTGVTWVLLAIAGLAFLGWIGMGEGDFLYLATASLLLNLQEILYLIEISCLLGLGYFLLSKEKKAIAFIPCLYMGLAIILLLDF